MGIGRSKQSGSIKAQQAEMCKWMQHKEEWAAAVGGKGCVATAGSIAVRHGFPVKSVVLAT